MTIQNPVPASFHQFPVSVDWWSHKWDEVCGFTNQRSLETGESLNKISIVIVPDPTFPAPTHKK